MTLWPKYEYGFTIKHKKKKEKTHTSNNLFFPVFFQKMIEYNETNTIPYIQDVDGDDDDNVFWSLVGGLGN